MLSLKFTWTYKEGVMKRTEIFALLSLLFTASTVTSQTNSAATGGQSTATTARPTYPEEAPDDLFRARLIPRNSKVYVVLALMVFVSTVTPVLAQQQSDVIKSHNIRSIALLPLVGDSTPDSIRQEINKADVAALKEAYPNLTIIGSDESLSRLDAEHRLDDLTSFLNLYTKTGAVIKDALGRLLNALKVETILVVHVQEYEAQSGSWLRARNGHNSVRAQYVLFSGPDIIWRHLVAYVHTPQWTAKADPDRDIAPRIARRAVFALSRNIQNTDPKKDVHP